MNYDYDSEQDTSPECGFAGLATAIIGGGLADLKEPSAPGAGEGVFRFLLV